MSQEINERIKSEQRLHCVIQGSPIPAFVIGKDHKVLYWNKALEELSGIKAGELIGTRQHWKAFYSKKRPCMADLLVDEILEVIPQWYSGKYIKSKLIEGAYEAVDFFPELGNEGKWLCFTAASIRDSQGDLIGAIETLEDITERKQAEAERQRAEYLYRTLARHAQSAVFIVQEGRFRFVNPYVTAYTGYEEAELLGTNPVSLIHPDDRESARRNSRQMIKRDRLTPYEFRIVRKDGDIRWIMETNTPVDFEGKPAVLMNSMDITERKQSEDDRRKLQNQLTQAQKMESIGTLAGGIAHDFNNILSGIMGYSELCLEAVRDRPKAYQRIEQVLKATDRAKGLVRQILTFSRKAEQEKKPIVLTNIVKEAANFMRASLPTTIEISLKVEETSDAVMADPTQMHQVLINLCTNAGQAMKETGGVLEIGLEEVVIKTDDLLQHPPIRHGHYLKLTVRDTGQGISPENLGRIFEPYFTTKEKGAGTGLGLAVVHGIVKDHGGEIRVYSEEGKGTIFRVYLPLMEKQEEVGKDMEEALLPGKGETILFIDDEKMVVDMSKELLEELGYRVVTETDPVKAIEVFKGNSDNFDIVITDKTMPHLTGFDVAREIRSVRAGIPIVLCSGFQEKDDLEKLTALGISQLIMKPIRMSVLAKAIRDVLDKDRFETQKT